MRARRGSWVTKTEPRKSSFSHILIGPAGRRDRLSLLRPFKLWAYKYLALKRLPLSQKTGLIPVHAHKLVGKEFVCECTGNRRPVLFFFFFLLTHGLNNTNICALCACWAMCNKEVKEKGKRLSLLCDSSFTTGIKGKEKEIVARSYESHSESRFTRERIAGQSPPINAQFNGHLVVLAS